MPILPFLTVVFYRFAIVILGAALAYLGFRLNKSSRMKTGEIEGSGQGFKVTLKNVGPGVLFIVLGIIAIIFGLCNPPKVAYEETTDVKGTVRRNWNIQQNGGENPKDLTIAELVKNSAVYDGKPVRIKGTVAAWLERRAGEVKDEFMRFTLEENKAQVTVFSETIEYFEVGTDEVTVTGICFIRGEKLVIDASPTIGGKIQKTKPRE
jgi:hypothetical protein